jgi:hypothetical protein
MSTIELGDRSRDRDSGSGKNHAFIELLSGPSSESLDNSSHPTLLFEFDRFAQLQPSVLYRYLMVTGTRSRRPLPVVVPYTERVPHVSGLWTR